MNDDDWHHRQRKSLRDLEAAVRHGDSSDDRINILRVHMADHPPGVSAYIACRWSLAARLVSDQRESAEFGADMVVNLGEALPVIAAEARPETWAAGDFVICGVAKGGRWLRWMLPGPPPEPPP